MSTNRVSSFSSSRCFTHLVFRQAEKTKPSSCYPLFVFKFIRLHSRKVQCSHCASQSSIISFVFINFRSFSLKKIQTTFVKMPALAIRWAREFRCFSDESWKKNSSCAPSIWQMKKLSKSSTIKKYNGEEEIKWVCVCLECS